MGREVKRVPVDFEWPLHQVWSGFLMPDKFHEDPCPAKCDNGRTQARVGVEGIAHLLLMLDDDLRAQERGRPMHPYFGSLEHYSQVPRPSADIAEFGAGLAGRASGFFGHDAIDRWHAIDKIIDAAGLPKTWGLCATCEGNASVEKYPGQREEAENWKETEPPTGDAWQVWETTSEGSPVSPPMATAEGLASWLVEHPATLGPGSSRITFEEALRWVTGSGWMPTGMFGPDGFRTGAALAADLG